MKKKPKKKRKLKQEFVKNKKPVYSCGWDERHPYPRWAGIATPREYIIGQFPKERHLGLEVTYHVTDLDVVNQYDAAELCRKHIRKLIRKEGGSLTSIITTDELCAKIKEQLEENEMYYTEIGREQVGFDTERLSRIMSKIVEAAREHFRVKIRYLKSTGSVIVRDCACYSYKEGYLYVTDIQHGNKKIRCYDVGRIRAVKISTKKFKPEWEIKL